MKILKSFFLVWTYPVSKKEKENMESLNTMGKSQIGVSEFFNSLEVFNKSNKYSFK
jgi:hypothetical protein